MPFDAATLLLTGGSHAAGAGVSLAVVLVHGGVGTGATYGGVACTLKVSTTKQALYFRVAPPQGTQAVTFDGGTYASVLTFYGMSRAADPFRDAEAMTGPTAGSVTLDSLSGDIGVGGGHAELSSAHTLLSLDVQRTQSDSGGDPQTSRCSGTEVATGASVTLTAEDSNASATVWFCGATIKPAESGNQVIWFM